MWVGQSCKNKWYTLTVHGHTYDGTRANWSVLSKVTSSLHRQVNFQQCRCVHCPAQGVLLSFVHYRVLWKFFSLSLTFECGLRRQISKDNNHNQICTILSRALILLSFIVRVSRSLAQLPIGGIICHWNRKTGINVRRVQV